MTADLREQTHTRATSSEADLRVELDTALPNILPVGRATAIFCCGTCFHRRRPVEGLELVANGTRHAVTASRMPRLDLFRALHPTLNAEQQASLSRDPASTEDPEMRCYRSGFWATVPIEPRARSGEVELRVEARLADGGVASAALGRIEVTEPEEPLSYPGLREGAPGLIAICMATFDPDIELLRTQIDSLRAQTDSNWICLISDDCSQPDQFAAIEDLVAGDPRFVVSRAERRAGFYGNFERALKMVPAAAEFVALCDQDDRWYPDKLEALRVAIGEAQLVYSDTRLVDPDGRVLAETLWEGRRNNYKNFASLLIANTIPGAASMFRRRMIDFALPFPEGPGWEFHDHWLGIVAMAIGEVSYVDRPLYDYVQHAGAILGHLAVDSHASQDSGGRRQGSRLRIWRGCFGRWRATYFRVYLQLEVQAQVLLIRCSAELSDRKRRALRRLITAGRSPLGLAWLAARTLRPVLGHNETLGTETQLLRGILWRRLIAIRTRGHDRPGGATYDASLPPFDVESLGQRRLRRWRARR